MASSKSVNVLRSAYTRVFMIEGRARPDHAPQYMSFLRMMGLSHGLGDIERIEAPSPDKYGDFEEISEVKGATERPTTSLEGRYAVDLRSELMRLARKGCAVDIQLHMGQCEDPSNFNDFSKAIILEKASFTNYGTDDLGALVSGDNTAVNENVDVSAKDMYEVVPMGYGVKAASIVSNEVIDVVICDNIGCGECEEESDGCYRIFAVTKAAGGSPSTPPDILFSIDKGVNWYAHDVESLGAAEDADGVSCIGSYIVIVSNDSNSLHYAAKSDFNGYTDPAFTENATGFVAGGEPNGIFSVGNFAFIVGDGGYIYKCEDPTVGVTVLDAGSATTATLLMVRALSKEFAVAVGNNGAIVYTENGTTWSSAPASPVGYGVTINCVLVKSEREWFVGCSNGRAYYTLNGGATWTETTFSNSGTGSVRSIEMSTDTIMWLAHDTAAPHGRIFRSFNGGRDWVLTPESGATMPVNDRINRLAVCDFDPNFIVGVGLADDGADGYVVVGVG